MRFIVGNWKMYLDGKSQVALAKKMAKLIKPGKVEVGIAPSFVSMQAVKAELAGSKIMVGGQDIATAENGAYTGEISPVELKAICDFVIVGHSERRKYQGESDAEIAAKVELAIRHDITPILCVGESLHENNEELTFTIVNDQVEAGLRNITAQEIEKVVIAYEPVWSLYPSNLPVEPNHAVKVAQHIRMTIGELYGDEAGDKIRILYGGSVDVSNAVDFLIDGLDGALVGHASTRADDFEHIIKLANDKG